MYESPSSSVARANLVWDETRGMHGGEVLDKDWRAPELKYEPAFVVPGIECWRDKDGPFPGWVTEALCRSVEQLILRGSSILRAKHVAGIGTKKWQQLREGHRIERAPYWQFMERLKLAEQHSIVRDERTMAALSEHPDPSVAYKAAVKRLEVRASKEWMPQTRGKVDVRVQGSVNVDVKALAALAALSPEQLEALVAGLRTSIEAGERLLVEAVPTLPTPTADEEE